MIAYRDRLTRFGYELLEELVIKYSQGRIKVINEKDKSNQKQNQFKM